MDFDLECMKCARQQSVSNCQKLPRMLSAVLFWTFRALAVAISASFPKMQSRYILPFQRDMAGKCAGQHRTPHRHI
jgi:hypothetical protein